MIFFSIGLPGHFAAWCDAVITRLAEEAVGPATLMSAESPDEVAVDLIRSTTPHLVVASRQPATSLRALLAEGGVHMVVALDDPRRAVRDLMASGGLDLCTATREVARSCAATLVCAGLPGAAVVHAEKNRADFARVTSTIAQSFGLGVGGAALAVPFTDAGGPIEPWWDALEPDQRAVADGALAAYAENFRGGGFGEIVWDRSLFWLAADPGRHADGAIELGDGIGPIVSGPEIGLPPGEWVAAVTLGVSKEALGVGLDIEVRSTENPAPLAQASVAADARGFCAANLRFVVAAPTGQTITLSIANSAPAPGGRLALGNVTLTPGPAGHSDIPSELTVVLGL